MTADPVTVAELLGRLHNPAAPLDALRVGGVVRSDLPERLAGAMRGIRGLQLALLQAKFLLIEGADRQACDLVFARHCQRAAQIWRSWSPDRSKDVCRLRNACNLAVELTIQLPACPACKRRGVARVGRLMATCERCNGTGEQHPRAASLARRLGVDRSRFQRTWRQRFELIRYDVQQTEEAALARLDRQFGRWPQRR